MPIDKRYRNCWTCGLNRMKLDENKHVESSTCDVPDGSVEDWVDRYCDTEDTFMPFEFTTYRPCPQWQAVAEDSVEPWTQVATAGLPADFWAYADPHRVGRVLTPKEQAAYEELLEETAAWTAQVHPGFESDVYTQGYQHGYFDAEDAVEPSLRRALAKWARRLANWGSKVLFDHAR